MSSKYYRIFIPTDSGTEAIVAGFNYTNTLNINLDTPNFNLRQLNTVLKPRLVNLHTRVTKVCLAYAHTVALGEDGIVWSWGNTPPGINSVHFVPHMLFNDKEYISIATSDNMTLALGSDGIVSFCSYHVSRKNFTISTRIIEISCGSYHAVLLDQENVAWIFNLDDQTKGISTHLMPEKITQYRDTEHTDGLPENADYFTFEHVSCGLNHTLMLSRDGRVFSFGNGDYGQLGHATFTSERSARPIKGLKDVIEIWCCENSSYVRLKCGSTFAFGDNNYFKLGVDRSINQSTLVYRPIKSQIPPDHRIIPGFFMTTTIDQQGFVHIVGDLYLYIPGKKSITGNTGLNVSKKITCKSANKIV